jgi:hypothetical protein
MFNMFHMRNLLPLVCFLLLSGPLQARELTDLSLEITTQSQGADAKQEAFDRATEEATHRLTEELLGPEKTARYWSQISPKLLKNSTRYVLFIKGSTPQTQADGTHLTVQMRLSPDALEALLRESGVFAGGSVRLLPLISVSDGRGGHYAWWTGEDDDKNSSLAREYFKKIFQHLNAHFKGKSVYVLDPSSASFRMSVPSSYRMENLRREDQSLLAEYLKADVVLSGRIDLVRPRSDSPEQRLSYGLRLWQVKNGRAVADANQSEKAASDAPKLISSLLDQTDKKVFADLAGKLGEAIASGSLNLAVLRLAVEGDLTFQQQADLKRQIGDIREIRGVRERLFEPSRVTFEVETQVSATDLAKAVQRTRFNGFRVGVAGVQDDSLVLSARATSAQ